MLEDVPRPRLHDLEGTLDAVERLVRSGGVDAVTVRAVAEEAGVSNGSIYHAFGSRAVLVATTWLRAAREFLTLLHEVVDADTGADPSGVVVEAALAPAYLAERRPGASAVLTAISRDEVLALQLPTALEADIASQQKELVGQMVRLAERVWGRRDGAAVDLVEACVVALPAALLLRGDRTGDPLARARVAAAVRALVELGPPARRGRTRTKEKKR